MLLEPLQTTLAEGVLLNEVTFVVVDLETTGGSPLEHAITEIGAVMTRGGERLGSFQSLVAPGQPIPPYVAHLTGIDDLMVSSAPPIEAVTPALAEFLDGSVFVAHNARFDFGFVNATLARFGYPLLDGQPVCTARLARRVVWPDVPNVKLQTLADYFRVAVKPAHRPSSASAHGVNRVERRIGFVQRLMAKTSSSASFARVARRVDPKGPRYVAPSCFFASRTIRIRENASSTSIRK